MGRWLRFLVVLGCFLQACGGEDKGTSPFISKPGPTGSGDGGVQMEDVDPLAPVITIMEPVAAADPNNDTVLTSDTLTVRCRATKSLERRALEVDQSSVAIKVSWLDLDGKTESLAAAVDAISDTEFEGTLGLAALPNGPIRASCSAKDVSSTMPRSGEANVDTFLDLGPQITIIEPKEGDIKALKNPVAIKFRVTAAPVSETDTEAAITDLALTVSGHPFDTEEIAAEPGVYTTVVDFQDTRIFEMAPSTAQITVEAKSQRTPEPGHRIERVNIELDSEGPTINITAPEQLQLVRGEVVLTVNITDPSGVDSKTVIGTINKDLFRLDDWKIVGSTYSQRFDTRSFGDGYTQLLINLRASDMVGNETIVDLGLRLDNVPPILSLDPPVVREYNFSGDEWKCSAAFDPLGDALSDGEDSLVQSLFRVLIWDRTNVSPGAQFGYLAGVEPSSVKIFLQRPEIPLLIDTDHDTEEVCDEIQVEADDPNDRAQQLSLDPVNVRGAAYYPADGAVGDDFEDGEGGFCTHGTADEPPLWNTLCNSSGGLTRAVNQDIEGVAPAVYGFEPTNADTGECAGNTSEFGNIFEEGWVCVVARAEDKIGNVAVSRPIRVCYGGSCPLPMPDCLVSGCSLPDAFEAPLFVPLR